MHPRKDEETFGTILYTSSRYELGDDQVSAEEIDEKMKDSSVIALPVYAYIHSGVVLNTKIFSCRFDSGQSGCIYISKEEVRRIFNVKRISPKLYKQVINSLESEVNIYSQYLNGEVYGYRIFDDNDQEIESCWGFYGFDTAQKEAQEIIKHYQKAA